MDADKCQAGLGERWLATSTSAIHELGAMATLAWPWGGARTTMATLRVTMAPADAVCRQNPDGKSG